MNLRFVTKNPHKASEVQEILRPTGVKIIHAPVEIHEIQIEDIHAIVRDKVLKAFTIIGRPVFIEHTGLYIDSLNGFPGGLTQVFWDKLQAEQFAALFGGLASTALTARTVIAYCDGRKIHTFDGEIRGRIAPEPKGDRAFQWDCIFIPADFDKTFAELGSVKNEISMRRRAFDKFSDYLLRGHHNG
ncbi:MAG: non-canonical purine NTP pyrophosphatase [Chromatiaceae bacterium]|nr:non-canonical purine NTP pyrophosphatase [Chromatiaceae bacterium]MBP8288518.1 non-canonical purine NTP pyrophosphatase [Chromatiaceae bacterium]MBP9602896.1 non-canonical purine NTP pyrophosphatase [Chromatiaceae bacterium]